MTDSTNHINEIVTTGTMADDKVGGLTAPETETEGSEARLKNYTIKLGTRFYAYGEVDIEAESPEVALQEFLANTDDYGVDWEIDWKISDEDLNIDGIEADQFSLEGCISLSGDASDEESKKWLASSYAGVEA